MTTGYRVDQNGAAIHLSDDGSMMVKLWDTGPVAPEPPARPELPTGKEGSPEYDLAMIDFRSALSTYETRLKEFGQEKKDFAEWHAKYGGAYQIEMFSVDAREALAIAPERYFVSDDRLKNHGLPDKRKPGKWHEEQKERDAQASRERARTMARDPVFGSQGAAL